MEAPVPTRTSFPRTLLFLTLSWVFQLAASHEAVGHSCESDDSIALECKDDLIKAQLRLAGCTARVVLLEAQSETSTSGGNEDECAQARSSEEDDSDRRDRRKHESRRGPRRGKQLQAADCDARYAEDLEELYEEYVEDEGLDPELCGLHGGAAGAGGGFLDRLCQDRAGFNEFILIGFEAADAVNPPNAFLVNSYSEQGFTVETTNLDPTSALSGVLGLDTTFFPNPGIRSVSQPPGDRVALPEDPIDNIVLTRPDGAEFQFLGGHVSFTNGLTQLRPATMSFEGYKQGSLVSSFSSDIVEQGALITVQMEEGIDTLVIKDNNPNGWAYLDNLMFLVR